VKALFALLIAIALLPAWALSAQPPPNADPWAGLRFLLGTWEATTTGGMAQAKSSGSYAFQLELRDHVMARHFISGDCKAPDEFDCQHTDLLYVYPAADGQAWQAIYFDNEGHVIHYNVSVPKPGTEAWNGGLLVRFRAARTPVPLELRVGWVGDDRQISSRDAEPD
jgi:hypothetical protein